MSMKLRRFLLVVCICIFAQTTWAAPAPDVQKVRYFAAPEKVRIVLDLSSPVTYKALQQEQSVTIELDAVLNKVGDTSLVLKDPSVNAIRLLNGSDGKARLFIDYRLPMTMKVFTLAKPNRLVIDLIRLTEQKTENELLPGIRYTSWFKPGQSGPLSIHILDIGPHSGYAIEPVLVRGDVLGVESLSHVFLRSDVLAAVNASYFAPNGDIIGLLKMDDEIISSTNIARTALGIRSDGKLMIGQVSYHGEAELGDGQTLSIDGVNEERGENGLILFNRFQGQTTKTNAYGMEYSIIADAVAAIQPGNSPIPANGYVLSAHGEAAKKLSGLKVGDTVHVTQTLGPEWDQASQVVGAGPMLVKDGHVFVTTKVEEFGSDVAGGRAPRTALGVTADGKMLLVVVDGRQAASTGMSLLELAMFMRELGAVDAMNFDGGGSSEMIVKGRIVNKPSDGKERRVGNALAVVPAKLAI